MEWTLQHTIASLIGYSLLIGTVTSFCRCGTSSGGGRVHQDIRLMCKSLDKNGGKWWVELLLVMSSTPRAISQIVLEGAALCASVPESELLFSLWAAVYYKETPTDLDWLGSIASRGKRAAPLEPLSSFWLGTNTWSLVMSFARRQQLKSSGRALLLAVRSDSACEHPVHPSSALQIVTGYTAWCVRLDGPVG